MSEQYDLKPADVEKLKQNAQRRLELRNEFLKLSQDPFRHATGEGGIVFDPAFQRFNAMKLSSYEYFKPNMKNARYGLAFIIIPIVTTMWLLKTDRDRKEHKFRTGQVAYKDRLFKLI